MNHFCDNDVQQLWKALTNNVVLTVVATKAIFFKYGLLERTYNVLALRNNVFFQLVVTEHASSQLRSSEKRR